VNRILFPGVFLLLAALLVAGTPVPSPPFSTPQNTPNAIVRRDSTGSFDAGTIRALSVTALSFSYYDGGSPGSGGGGGGAAKYGTFASRPSAGTSGNLYIASDSPTAEWVDDGATWHPLVNGTVVGTQPKAASNFSQFNDASAHTSITDRNGTLHFSFPADGAGSTTVRGQVESLSSSTMHVEAAIVLQWPLLNSSGGFPGGGIMMLESGTGKFMTFNIATWSSASPTEYPVEIAIWSNANTRVSNNTYLLNALRSGPFFQRLEVSGSNILAKVSTDAQNWITIQTTALTTAFTSAPNHVGFEAVEWVGTDNTSFDIPHYVSGT
jgi:hypothetical protein